MLLSSFYAAPGWFPTSKPPMHAVLTPGLRTTDLLYSFNVTDEVNVFRDLTKPDRLCSLMLMQHQANIFWIQPLISSSLESALFIKVHWNSFFLSSACSCLRLYIFNVIQIWWSCEAVAALYATAEENCTIALKDIKNTNIIIIEQHLYVQSLLDSHS